MAAKTRRLSRTFPIDLRVTTYVAIPDTPSTSNWTTTFGRDLIFSGRYTGQVRRTSSLSADQSSGGTCSRKSTTHWPFMNSRVNFHRSKQAGCAQPARATDPSTQAAHSAGVSCRSPAPISASEVESVVQLARRTLHKSSVRVIHLIADQIERRRARVRRFEVCSGAYSPVLTPAPDCRRTRHQRRLRRDRWQRKLGRQSDHGHNHQQNRGCVRRHPHFAGAILPEAAQQCDGQVVDRTPRRPLVRRRQRLTATGGLVQIGQVEPFLTLLMQPREGDRAAIVENLPGGRSASWRQDCVEHDCSPFDRKVLTGELFLELEKANRGAARP